MDPLLTLLVGNGVNGLDVLAKNTKPPVQDKGTGENTNTKLEASEIPPATPVRASTSITTTDAEPSTAVVCPTASVIPIATATATAAASEEGQTLSRTSSPAPLPPPPPVPRRAAKRHVQPGSPKAAESGEKASNGTASRVSGEQSRASERPSGEVQPATEAEIKPGVVDHVKHDGIVEDAKPKPSSSESAGPSESSEPVVISSPSKPVSPPRRAAPPTSQPHYPSPTPSHAPATPEKSSSPSEQHSLSNNGHNNAVENGVSPDYKPADNGTYIGERTWKERTWKTLVKLREDMFWARIEGVR
ncbi:hypothetical protein BU17DRAFT_71181 [Hysterangium stoloniferum]|nr:hypothetical protein BU17DRAFT_71181 [Hysterangium stoloniferum]